MGFPERNKTRASMLKSSLGASVNSYLHRDSSFDAGAGSFNPVPLQSASKKANEI
jgi:hypothetical protein